MARSAGTARRYSGDARLGELLRRAGSLYDPPGARNLIASVLAAPPGPDPAAWTALVAPRPSSELKAELQALAGEIAAATRPATMPRAERLAALRGWLGQQGVHGFLVPRGDEHQGEYVPARAQRLQWLTGFSGSAGLAVVLPQQAAIFIDGRYTLQAEKEV